MAATLSENSFQEGGVEFAPLDEAISDDIHWSSGIMWKHAEGCTINSYRQKGTFICHFERPYIFYTYNKDYLFCNIIGANAPRFQCWGRWRRFGTYGTSGHKSLWMDWFGLHAIYLIIFNHILRLFRLWLPCYMTADDGFYVLLASRR